MAQDVLIFVPFVAIYVKCHVVFPSTASIPTTSIPPTDGATTTTVTIAVVVVIILVVIVIGVVILVVLFRVKKKNQHLVIYSLRKVTTEKEDIEIELKYEQTTEKEASSNTDQPPYAEIQTEAPPDVPSKSEDLVNLNSPLTVGYSEIELEPDDSK